MDSVSATELSTRVRGELRSSHAGETGAVWIYRGILFVQRFRLDRDVRRFASHHLDTEKQHLCEFEAIIHSFRGSLLLPFWMLAGYLTGSIPAMLGADWVYYTVYRVERFVDIHYRKQITLLEMNGSEANHQLIMMLQHCNADEIAHKDEAL